MTEIVIFYKNMTFFIKVNISKVRTQVLLMKEHIIHF